MLRPGRTVRRQANWSPSAVIKLSENHGPVWKDPGFQKLLFPIIIVYLTQVCTGYDATLTSNLNSFKEWKLGTNLLSPANGCLRRMLMF